MSYLRYRRGLNQQARVAHTNYFGEHLSLSERQAFPVGDDLLSSSNKIVGTNTTDALAVADSAIDARVIALEALTNEAVAATPVNAVASQGTLTIGGDLVEGEQLLINGRIYTASSDATYTGDVRIDTSGTAVGAVGAITFSGVVIDGETVTVNTRVYEFDSDSSIANDVAIDISGGTKTQATGTLTITNPVVDGETVTIGTEVFEFDVNASVVGSNVLVDISAGTKVQAAETLTLTGVLIEGETFTIDTEVYEIDADGVVSGANIAVDVSAHMAQSQGTLTLGGAVPSNNEAMTVGAQTYTWKTTLTGAADEIKIGSTIDDCIDNFTYAINAGIGAGTLYGTGTTANASVTAAKTGGTTSVLTAIVYGVIGNAIASTETMADVANVFDNTTLGTTTAGVDCPAADGDGVIITSFTNGTALDITASQGAGTTIVFTATAAGALDGGFGNGIASTSVMANGGFGSAALTGGSDCTANEASAALETDFNAGTAYAITATDGTGSVAFNADAAGAQDGSVGNLASTTTMANATFATGTLLGGSDATANEASAALHAAITGDASKEVTSTDNTGSVGVVADELGTLPNAWATTTTCANGGWAAGTLGGGTDAGAADAVTAIALAITNDVSAIVTAVDGALDTVVLTAKTKGTSGDLITLTTDIATGSLDGAGFMGGTVAGVDGTIGDAGSMLYDATNLYITVAANTVADANWKKLVLQAL